jgi:hypothetical protein
LLPYLPENIRQYVFGIRPIPDNSENQAEGKPVIARIERIQRSSIFRRHALEQLTVFLFNARFVCHYGWR